MKKIYYVLGIGLVIAFIVIGILFIILSQGKSGTAQNPNNPFGGFSSGTSTDTGTNTSTGTGNNGTNTNTGSNSNTGTGSGTNQIIPIQLTNGSTVKVPDFTKTNQPPVASATSGYQVAGSVNGDFQILYFPAQSYFLISLLAEPLGANRKAAEAELRAKLGLPDSQLCKLNIEVNTIGSVNNTYAGENLGLSFCPGAVLLP